MHIELAPDLLCYEKRTSLWNNDSDFFCLLCSSDIRNKKWEFKAFGGGQVVGEGFFFCLMPDVRWSMKNYAEKIAETSNRCCSARFSGVCHGEIFFLFDFYCDCKIIICIRSTSRRLFSPLFLLPIEPLCFWSLWVCYYSNILSY